MALATPYLMFVGDAPDQLAAKVAIGVVHWRPEWCKGQLRLAGCKADLGIPDMSIADAVKAGCKTMVIGVANRHCRSSGPPRADADRRPPPVARLRRRLGTTQIRPENIDRGHGRVGGQDVHLAGH